MMSDWRNKSALQRYADDLEQRKFNLKAKILENKDRIELGRGKTFKANDKSDDYLLRHFFVEYTSQCQKLFFPKLLLM